MSAMIPFVGNIAAGESAKAAADRNAEMMRREADIARQQGTMQAEARGRAAREMLGRQRAALGQAGIGWEGSAQDIMLESATAAELDSLNTIYETELRAKGLLNQATVTVFEGKQARRASRFAAAQSLLDGAAKYAAAGAKI